MSDSPVPPATDAVPQSPPRPPLTLGRALAVALQFAVSVALIWWAVSQIDLGAVRARVAQASWLPVGGALAALLAQVYVTARRWRRLNAGLDLGGSVGWHLRVMLVSLFFGQLLPSVVGGDAYRMWGVARHGGHGWRAGVLSVICDRGLGLSAHLLLMLLLLPFLAAAIGTGEAFWGVAATGATGVGAFAFAVAYGKVPGWLSFLKVADALVAPARALKRLLSDRREFIALVGTSVAVHLFTILAFWLLARAFAVPFTAAEALAVVPPVFLLSVLPISVAGWGVREGAMLAAFAMLGHPASDAVVLSVGFGLLGLAVGLIGGVIWGILPGQARKNLP